MDQINVVGLRHATKPRDDPSPHLSIGTLIGRCTIYMSPYSAIFLRASISSLKAIIEKEKIMDSVGIAANIINTYIVNLMWSRLVIHVATIIVTNCHFKKVLQIYYHFN